MKEFDRQLKSYIRRLDKYEMDKADEGLERADRRSLGGSEAEANAAELLGVLGHHPEAESPARQQAETPLLA